MKGKAKVTPEGLATYAWLNKPNTRFDPCYSVNMTFNTDDEAYIKFKAMIEEFLDEALEFYKGTVKPAVAKRLTLATPFKMVEDEDGEEVEGKEMLVFKLKQFKKDKDTGESEEVPAPPVFDKAGKPLAENLYVNNGSTGKVSAYLSPYYMAKDKAVGVSLKLNAFQLIKGGSGSGGDGSASGFGFECEEADSNDIPWETEDSNDSTGDDNGDF